MEKFDRIGVWWLPGEERSKAVGGRLWFDDGRGLRLERWGVPSYPSEDTYKAILGQSTDGYLWTLEDCSWLQPRGGVHGDHELVSERCHPAAAYQSTHLHGADARLFVEAGCSFSGLPRWLHEDLFKFDAGGA